MVGIVGNKSAARGLSNSGESKTTSNKDNRNRRRHHELRDLQSNSKARPPQVNPRIVALHQQRDAASSKARSHGRAEDPSVQKFIRMRLMLVVVVLIKSFMPLHAHQQWCFFKIPPNAGHYFYFESEKRIIGNIFRHSPVPPVFKPLTPLAFFSATRQFFLDSAPATKMSSPSSLSCSSRSTVNGNTTGRQAATSPME